jgi:hypothetical protein
MSENNTEFQFKPRNEAHAMNWSNLLPPVRRAVADLLVRISGAELVTALLECNVIMLEALTY